MKLLSALALALVLVCAPALAQVTPGTSPLSVAKGGIGATSASSFFDNAYCNTIGFLIVRTTGAWTCSKAFPADPVWWGADPTGTVDSSAAFNSAVAASNHVKLSCGTYKINIGIANKNFFTFEGSPCTQLIQNSTAANLINITYNNGGGSAVYKGFVAFGAGTLGSGISLNLSGSGGGNVTFRDLNITGFPITNISCVGTPTAISSGNKVLNSYLLNAGSENLHWEWCTDGMIYGNNFGGAAAQYAVPAINVHLTNASANQVIGNLVYNSLVGVQADTASQFNWFNENRITQQGHQGFLCNGCNFSNIQNNQFYQNSNATIGGNGSAELFSATYVLISNNNFFDWSGTSHTSYSVVADGASSFINMIGNSFKDNVTGGANFLATSSRATDNIGFNPQGNTTITVTASPFTYRAGPTQEDVFIFGGTITGVNVGANPVNASTSQVVLGPNQTMVVAYTAAPTMFANKQ